MADNRDQYYFGLYFRLLFGSWDILCPANRHGPIACTLDTLSYDRSISFGSFKVEKPATSFFRTSTWPRMEGYKPNYNQSRIDGFELVDKEPVLSSGLYLLFRRSEGLPQSRMVRIENGSVDVGEAKNWLAGGDKQVMLYHFTQFKDNETGCSVDTFSRYISKTGYPVSYTSGVSFS